jgi:hypothetical protein
MRSLRYTELVGERRASTANSSSSGFRSQSTVTKYVARNGRGRSQTWKTVLRNHAPDIAATDMFIVPTVGFKLLYGIVIMRLDRRRLVWTNATTNPNADWNGRRLGVAIGGTRRKPVLIAAGVIVLGVLFAELDRGSQKPSETEFVAVGVN